MGPKHEQLRVPMLRNDRQDMEETWAETNVWGWHTSGLFTTEKV